METKTVEGKDMIQAKGSTEGLNEVEKVKTEVKEPIGTAVPSEAGKGVYNSRYKYGYKWDVYAPLGNRVMEVMKMVGCDGKKIIDIGCGVGWFTNDIYYNVSRDVKGIDFAEKAIDHYARLAYPSIEFEVADVYKYDYTGFEVAVVTEVLEHLQGDLDLLKRLPKGCKVFATVPNDHEREDFTHVRYYTEDSIRERYGDILDLKLVSIQGQSILFWGEIK